MVVLIARQRVSGALIPARFLFSASFIAVNQCLNSCLAILPTNVVNGAHEMYAYACPYQQKELAPVPAQRQFMAWFLAIGDPTVVRTTPLLYCR